MPRERIYTKAGDDGTTGLFYGGRVAKDSELPTAYGTVDEAQAVLGLARAHAGAGSKVDEMLVPIMRDLYVLMAELATLPENREKLHPGMSSVTVEMVVRLEHLTRSHRGAARRAPCAAGRRAAVAGGALPQSVVRPAVDDGPLARGDEPPGEGRLTGSVAGVLRRSRWDVPCVRQTGRP